MPTDTERLDWLEKRFRDQRMILCLPKPPTAPSVMIRVYSWWEAREAIDAAMKEQDDG